MPFKLASADYEYEKNKLLKKEDVNKLMVWLESQPHLPKLDELVLIFFLRGSLYSIESCKRYIDNYCTLKTMCPEFFSNRNPNNEELRIVYDTCLFVFLPGLTPDGYKVLFVKLLDTNPSKFNFVDHIKAITMYSEAKVLQEGTAHGYIYIVDFEGASIQHLFRTTVTSIKHFLFYIQECSPLRIIGCHFFNSVSFMDKVMMAIKPFINKELMHMLHVHTKPNTTLYEYVPKNMLPLEYGGESPSTADLQEDMIRVMMEAEDYFVEEEKFRVDESKRPEKEKIRIESMFGVTGNFKKLEID